MGRAILFVEEFSVHTIGIPLHSKGTILEMWQDNWRDADEVVDHLSFRESDFGIKDLVEIRYLNLTAFDD
jgi:hypothetical protein